MAEMLVRKTKTWSEDKKPAKWDKLKWDSVTKRGDIVEVREDGYFRIEHLGSGNHGWNRKVYAVLRIPGTMREDMGHLEVSYNDAIQLSAKPTKAYKNRYKIQDLDQIAWNKNSVTVSGKQFEEWYADIPSKAACELHCADKVI